MIPNKQPPLELSKKSTADPFHINHGLIASGVMEYCANELC